MNIPRGNLTVNRVLGRHFRFSARSKNNVLAPSICFLGDGTIAGYHHQNEAGWRIENGRLVLLNALNVPSCIFDEADPQDGKLQLSGRFLLNDEKPVHFIDELPSASERLTNLPRILSFEGEFGEEVNSFIPYIHWLYKVGEMVGRKVETYAGMEPFYFFLDSSQISFRADPRRHVLPENTPPYYLHQCGLMANQVGMECSPNYREQFKTDFGFSKPLLVIHNKFTEEWGGPPVNFFSNDTLDTLFERLKSRYQIVFFEAAKRQHASKGYSFDHQALIEYDDAEVAAKHRGVLVFADLLRTSTESYNALKLRVFSSCFNYITVQGGNAHMCALFPGSLVAIQHIRGSEEAFGYSRGTFQFLANPRPTYLIGRTGIELLDIAAAFEDSAISGDRVVLGKSGLSLCERYNPLYWRGATV